MNCLSDLDDPRKPSNGTLHDFLEMLMVAVAVVLSDCDMVEYIALWGRAKETWLRKFLVLTNGIPSEETFLRVFRVRDPKQFESAFRRWVCCIVGALRGTIAVDGKTVRGSGSAGETTIHMLSAFATDSGGDYRLADKGNQPTLLQAIETAFIDQHQAEGVDRQREVQQGHGQLVGQIASVLPAQGIVNPADWSESKTIGRIDSLRQVADKQSDLGRRYTISSRALTAEQRAVAARAHWGVENRLHSILDVSFGEDGSTLRKNNAPQNLSLLKKIVLSIIRLDMTHKARATLPLKRKAPPWNYDLREHARTVKEMASECRSPVSIDPCAIYSTMSI
ncbi:ISAs1 family transposase [Accumulibacter sp.]|uniref:ISAs1 family transposase n=1 Tax=Accumulibacter sp. TaxID=2053492 RepID=UPI0028C4AE63|nr:ISAs1 family transposase [Accumulibacter sp.]